MITAGQVTATSTAQSLCAVPPGPATVILSNAGTMTAFFGVASASGTLTSSNGFPIPSGGLPVSIPCYQTDHGGSISVITANATSIVGWWISRP